MLTTAQRLLLKAELTQDPLGRGYASMGHDEAAESLNVANRIVVRKISKNQILRWSAETGGIAKLRNAVATFSNGRQAASDAALAMLQTEIGDLHLDAEVMALLNSLVAGNVLTDSDRSKLLTRAVETVSRCDELCGAGSVCDNQDIYVARVEL